MTAEIAREQGLEMDLEGFAAEMEAQRRQSRASHAFTGSMEMVTAYEDLGLGVTPFVGYAGGGYAGLRQDTTVDAILVYPLGGLRPSVAGRSRRRGPAGGGSS